MIAMHYAPCSCCCIPKDTLLQCYYAYAHTCPIINQVMYCDGSHKIVSIILSILAASVRGEPTGMNSLLAVGVLPACYYVTCIVHIANPPANLWVYSALVLFLQPLLLAAARDVCLGVSCILVRDRGAGRSAYSTRSDLQQSVPPPRTVRLRTRAARHSGNLPHFRVQGPLLTAP